MPSNTSGASVCKVSAGGVLTDPSADSRTWCRVRLYTDLVPVSSMDAAGYTDEACTADGRICANAQYNAVGLLPCYEYRAQVEQVNFDPSMVGFAKVTMNYWFYGYTALKSLLGWDYLRVASMRYAFTSCTGFMQLSLRDLDCSGITDLFYTFSGCTNLTTITVGKDFVGPGLTSAGCFYNCAKLVRGNGMAYSSNAHSAAYSRVDAAGSLGYLTAV